MWKPDFYCRSGFPIDFHDFADRGEIPRFWVKKICPPKANFLDSKNVKNQVFTDRDFQRLSRFLRSGWNTTFLTKNNFCRQKLIFLASKKVKNQIFCWSGITIDFHDFADRGEMTCFWVKKCLPPKANFLASKNVKTRFFTDRAFQSIVTISPIRVKHYVFTNNIFCRQKLIFWHPKM